MKYFFLLCSFLVAGMVFSLTVIYAGISPAFSLNNYESVDGSYEPNLYDLLRYYSLPALGKAGFQISNEHLEAAMFIEARQDFSAFLLGRDFSNLPLSVGSWAPFFDANYPRVGYIQWGSSSVLISAGRRKLKWGPATYDIGLSSVPPYFDHLWLQFSDETFFGSFDYNFFAISADRSVYGDPKTLLGHKWAFSSDAFRLSFAEENLIYGVYPDLQDIGPFIIYHHSYQTHSNVMFFVTAEMLLKSFRIYGEFGLDEFRLNTEGENSRPTAFGWLAGVEWSSSEIWNKVRNKEYFDDFTLFERGLSTPSAVKLRYEYYHTTPYLYNRDADIGKFTYPFRLNVMWLNMWPDIDFFFGFPYGPDVSLHLLSYQWNKEKIELFSQVEFLAMGSYGIDSPYYAPYEHDWYKLVEPVSRQVILTVRTRYYPESDFGLFGLLSLKFTADGLKWLLNFGISKSYSF
ncbi:hypothetical protein AT15_07550 [Kosmotoga arenicorallina S304]|uniref:Capsule assembly Wzi family protein n=1 Tax=Kosmotoga arenicorallina S304 TaxID=1453497 RepID=A0A176K316_9BACT|nr:hypothetical protein [Kosmotoga arenicorallina]OAA31343.1 hypothetical protein AT15_07550 [Kosmotoga arenicorallina S304]